MKLSFHAVAVAVCLAVLTLAAPQAEATCSVQNGLDAVVTTFDSEFNDYGVLFKGAMEADCHATVRTKLQAKLASARISGGTNYWKGWLMGAYVSFVSATGLQLGAAGQMTPELDNEIRHVMQSFQGTTTGAAIDPCGLKGADPAYGGREFSFRANSCMDDHTIAAQGWAWAAAYLRLTGRSFQYHRDRAIEATKWSLREYDSICVHRASTYVAGYTPCNASIADLGQSGVEIISLNHGNQAPNYGFGLLTSIAAATVALEAGGFPLASYVDWTADERKVLKYLWKEATDHTQANGVFRTNKQQTPNGNCYNMAGPLAGTRTLVANWGCEDQQYGTGDPTEGQGGNFPPDTYTPNEQYGYYGYRARWFGLAAFYERHLLEKGDGNGYHFQPWDFHDTFFPPTAANRSQFFGVARRETYKTLGADWVTNRPALYGGTVYRNAVQTHFGKYFKATNGGGSTITATATWEGDAYSQLDLVDLDGGLLETGDQVALKITKNGVDYYFVAEGGGGGATNINRTSVGPWETFTITKLYSSDPIVNQDQFYLQAWNGQYVVAEGGGGGAINANRSTPQNYETFRFIKRERPF